MSFQSNSSGNFNVPRNIGLPRVNAGDDVSESHINRISEGIDRTTIRSGIGYNVNETSHGTTIKLKNIGGGNGSFGRSPLQASCVCINKNKSGIGDARLEFGVYISVGTVNLEVPEINGTLMDLVPKEDAPWHFKCTGNGYIVVKVSAEKNKPFPSKNVELKFLSGDKIISYESTSSEGYFPIARVVKSSSSLPTSVDGHSYEVGILSRGNLRVNRIKAYENDAIWNWSTYGF